MSPFLLAVLFLIVIYKFFEFLKKEKPQNIPPGLPWVPFFGSYGHLLWGNYTFPYKTLDYYVEKLKSKVVSAYFGGFYVVIANDAKSVKEVLTREEFDGRLTDAFIVRARAWGKELGIFFTEGAQWQEQRRFALRHMRDFGFGRRQDKFERDVMQELSLLVDTLKNGPINDYEKEVLKNDRALFPDILYPFSASSIWLIMAGEHFERGEHVKAAQVCRSAMMFQRASATTGGAIFQRPFLRYFGNMFGYTNIIKGNSGVVAFIQEHLARIKKVHHVDNDNGMIDRYLNELKNSEKSDTFSEEQLVITLLDFMFPALSAMPVTITHCIKHVLHNPDVLKKVQEEIDRVVGTGRLVTWEDRKSLPYTEATIRESLRYETLTPLGIIHKCIKDTTLGGYHVAKGTPVITNLVRMNEDPEFWGDPENFRPERFLKENGELGKDPTFPFGFGHRVCAGETFARYNIFGVFATLVQNFNLSFIEGQPNRVEDKFPGLVVTPKDLWLRFEPRA